ncbi:MAG: glycosyltransferase [Burkholderiaceae bacterium]|nr:glycosyltransferase [Burkholderiaceae bacterium]
MGGANLLGFMLECAQRAAPIQNARIYVLLNARMLPASARAQVDDFLPLRVEQVDADGPLRALIEAGRPELLIFYKDLKRTLQALQIDVVGPSGFDLKGIVDIPWFAYIPDFQHQHLHDFFSQEERFARDRAFRSLVENSAGVFVNSASVAADIERLYPSAARRARILRIPQLLPPVGYDLAEGFQGLLARRQLRPRYILSCSQRWMHKQHDLIVQAFARIAAEEPDLDLVFTGDTTETRAPDYGRRVEALIDCSGLRERVRYLGLIPRDEQLALIDHAQLLVQASLFEGGPGASGMLEAALLGTPIVASDIGPNRELYFAAARYFPAASVDALACALRETLKRPAGQRAAPFDAAQIEFLATASGIQFLAAMRAAAAALTPMDNASLASSLERAA